MAQKTYPVLGRGAERKPLPKAPNRSQIQKEETEEIDERFKVMKLEFYERKKKREKAIRDKARRAKAK